MYNFLTKNGQVFAFGLGILITVLYLLFVLPGLEEFNMLAKEEKGTTGIFNFGLTATLILVVIAGLVAIFAGVFHTVTNFQASVKGIIGVVALLAVFLILYASASPETSGPIFDTIKDFNVSENQDKIITGAISTALILAAGAALSFIVFGIRNLFK